MESRLTDMDKAFIKQTKVVWICKDCKTYVKSLERHFQRGMKTIIRTNYYCDCKPKRYYNLWMHQRESWEEIILEKDIQFQELKGVRQ